MKTVLVVAYAHIFNNTIDKMVADHPGMPYTRSRGNNWAKIGDTTYRWMASPDHMRGRHGVEVEFWGPLPHPDKVQAWNEQAMVARME